MTWHRFHPLTPFLRGGVMIAAVFGWLLSQQFSRVFGAPADDPTGGHWGIAAVGIVVVVSGGVLLGWISWRAARYRLGSSTVELKSGVVFRQHRQVRYDRIQAVEITRPLMARLVGLSSVKVEAAGGLMSSIQLAYLPHAQALDIRADLLAQARSREVAGPRASSGQGVSVMPAAPVSGSFPDAAIWPAPQGAAYDLPAPEGAPVDGLAPGAPVDGLAPGAPRVQPALAAAGEVPARLRGIPMGSDDVIDGAQQIAAIPAARVWAATGFSGSTLFLIPAIPVLIFALINRSLGILPWLGPMVLALIGQQAGKLTSWANFRVLATDDAILVRHGLTELRSATIHRGQPAAPLAALRLVEGSGQRRVGSPDRPHRDCAHSHRDPRRGARDPCRDGAHLVDTRGDRGHGCPWEIPPLRLGTDRGALARPPLLATDRLCRHVGGPHYPRRVAGAAHPVGAACADAIVAIETRPP